MTHNVKRILAAVPIVVFIIGIICGMAYMLLTDPKFRLFFSMMAGTAWLLWAVIYVAEHKWNDGSERDHSGPGMNGY